jgi:hypothetical protein
VFHPTHCTNILTHLCEPRIALTGIVNAASYGFLGGLGRYLALAKARKGSKLVLNNFSIYDPILRAYFLHLNVPKGHVIGEKLVISVTMTSEGSIHSQEETPSF